MDDAHKIAKYCEELFSLEDIIPSGTPHYPFVPLCIIDAIFSINVKYTSTKNTVERYCKYYDLPILPNSSSDKTNLVHTVSDFIHNVEKVGIESFTVDILKNRQRTSSRNGILKSEAAYKWAKILKECNIETFDKIPSNGLSDEIDSLLMEVPGQRSGISLNYFYMLCGSEDRCKPDRHVIQFLSECVGRAVGMIEAQALLTNTLKVLNLNYPSLTLRFLDYTIWGYMSALSNQNKSCRPNSKSL
jgi:hypothetical protein